MQYNIIKWERKLWAINITDIQIFVFGKPLNWHKSSRCSAAWLQYSSLELQSL